MQTMQVENSDAGHRGRAGKKTEEVVVYVSRAEPPDISGAIALATAIDYVESFGMAAIERYEAELRSRDRVPRRQGRCRRDISFQGD